MLRPLDQKGPARRERFVAEFAAQTALLAASIALSRFGGTAALWVLPWVGATIARASPRGRPVHRGALCPRARRPCVGQRRRGSPIGDAGGRVRLSVPDDGRGCATPTGGCGLTGLRERLALRGGPVQAADRAEGGWALRVEISG